MHFESHSLYLSHALGEKCVPYFFHINQGNIIVVHFFFENKHLVTYIALSWPRGQNSSLQPRMSYWMFKKKNIPKMYKGISKVQVWSRMYVVQKENKIINMPYQSACLVGCTFKKCYDTCITCCLIQLQLNHWTFQNVGFWPVKHKGNLTKRRIGQRNSIGVLDCPIKSFLL